MVNFSNRTCILRFQYLRHQHASLQTSAIHTYRDTNQAAHSTQPMARKAKRCYHIKSRVKDRLTTNLPSYVQMEVSEELQGQNLPLTSEEPSPEESVATNVGPTYVEPSDTAKVASYALNFEIKGAIGSGTFATVLLARCEQDGSLYAMKRMKLEPSKGIGLDKRSYLSLVKHEVAVLSLNTRTRSSPFLLALKMSFVLEEHLYIVTDFFSGGNLAQLQEKFPPYKRLPEHMVQFYCAEMAAAVGFVHLQGLLHRDIKLENFLISHDGHIVLADFGLSTWDPSKGLQGGTYEYMAPEVLGRRPYWTASDWWSLAICVHLLLFGKHPMWHDSLSLEENIGDILNIDIELDEVDYVRNPYAYAFLRHMLVYEPEHRLGYGPNGFLNVLDHPYISNFDRSKLLNKKLVPPAEFPPQDFSHIKFDDESMAEVPRRIAVSYRCPAELQVTSL